jgi:hypothetical protein
MITKTKRITAIINTCIVALIIGGGAIAKIFKAPFVIEEFGKLGVANYTQILGTFELIFLALLLYPKTVRVGYILLVSYLAGAIATHLAHGEISFQPAVPIVFITLSIILRDKSFFIPSSNRFIN